MARFKKHKKPKQGKEPDRKSKKRLSKQAVWSILIGLLMILSVAGIIVFDEPTNNNFKYNAYKFKLVDGTFITKINKKEISFNYLPQDVEYINVPDSLKLIATSSPQILMSFQPNIKDMRGIDLARFDIKKSLSSNFNKYVLEGVAGADSRYVLTYLDCENATQFTPMVYFEESNNTEIVLDSSNPSCYKFRGISQDDFLRLKDRFLYLVYGVMEK